MTISEKALWGWPQYAASATLSAGSWEENRPITFLQDVTELSRRARTTDAEDGSFEIRGLWEEAVAIRTVLLLRHNFTTDALWERIFYSDDAWTDEVYSSGLTPVWPVLDLDLEWEDNNWWTATYTEEERAATQTKAIDILPERIYAQSFVIRVYDSGNPDGFLAARVLDIARDMQLPVNYRYGASWGLESRTQSQEAKGGAEYFDIETPRGIFRGQVPQVPDADIKKYIYQLQRLADTHTPFLYIKNPSDSSTWLEGAGFVRSKALDPIEHASAGRSHYNFDYREAL